MRSSHRMLLQLAAGVATLSLVLAACSSGSTPTPSASSAGGASAAPQTAAAGGSSSPAAQASVPAPGSAGTVNLAVNPWVGYEADAAVVAYILKNKLGYTVKEQNIVEQVSWQGFANGTVDAILENWGHEDLKAKYIDQQKVAQAIGPMGATGIIGWYVPQWMADQYPDITDWNNLNKYASMFKTSESGDKGQLLDGDPSYVTNDVALVQNLNLNYKVVQGGSEAALITSLKQATTQKTPILAYFYEPQWVFAQIKLARIKLPPYTTGCDADPKKVACDYPPYILDKIVSAKFAQSNSKAYQLIKNFTWTNDDQNTVSQYIADQKMSDDQAAEKWLNDNPTKWQAWMPAN